MLHRTSSSKETRKNPDNKITSGSGINLGDSNNVPMLAVDMIVDTYVWTAASSSWTSGSQWQRQLVSRSPAAKCSARDSRPPLPLLLRTPSRGWPEGVQSLPQVSVFKYCSKRFCILSGKKLWQISKEEAEKSNEQGREELFTNKLHGRDH